MKKLLMLGLIVPAAFLIASVGFAADSPDVQTDQELNQDLNERASTERNDDAQERSVDRAESARDSREIADRRGRQPRRGQTAIAVAAEQGKSDDNSGKSADEDPDEDEDEDGETPIAN